MKDAMKNTQKAIKKDNKQNHENTVDQCLWRLSPTVRKAP